MGTLFIFFAAAMMHIAWGFVLSFARQIDNMFS